MIETFHARTLEVNGKKYYVFKDVLIYDIETKKKNINGPISPENASFLVWGAFSYNTGKLIIGRTAKEFQELVNNHKIIVGHNIKGFDNEVMKNDLGINFFGKEIIDTLELLRKPASKNEKLAYEKKGKKAPTGRGRANIIAELGQKGIKDNRFPDFKLGTIAEHGHKIFGNHPTYSQYFTEMKQDDFDYTILNKENLTDDNWNYIHEYLRRDILVTKNLFEFLEKYFESFAEDMADGDILNLQYAQSSMGKYVYKIFCNLLGLEEKYGNQPKPQFPGAYVFLPTKDMYGPKDGDGYCLDFNSQHPSHERMMNLATPAEKCKHKINDKCPTAHSGDGVIFKLKGSYCACEQGEIEKIITKWYMDRLAFKKVKDPREYAIKIKINGTYGVLSSPIFESIYNEFTGIDTTLMSVQSIKFMHKWMMKGGYLVVYGDTDSLYLFDPFKDKERMMKYVNEGIAKIKAVLPFADEYYKMGIDAEFSHIFFFLDEKTKEYKKKNYIYIKKGYGENPPEIIIKGLPLLKANAPELARQIYIKYLEPIILKTKNLKFEKEYLTQLLEHEIKQDMRVLIKKFKVSNASNYASQTSINAQISNKYLNGKDGIWAGIKHKREGYGVGKTTYYCNLSEARRLSVHEYDLDNVWKVLDPFVKKEKQANLFSF